MMLVPVLMRFYLSAFPGEGLSLADEGIRQSGQKTSTSRTL